MRVDSGDAVLEFSSGIARRARTTVDGAWGAGEKEQFRPVRIVVNGRDIASDAVVEAPLGDSLRFDLTFEYTTIMPTANYVVAAAPTWGNHPEGSIRLAGLPRPVRRAWQTVHFAVPSAPTPGLHHVIVLMGAEDSAEHLLSLTAWTRGLPVWNDGRDAQDMTLAQLDSLRLNNRVSLLKDAGSYRGKQSQVRVGDLALDRTQPGMLITLPAQHFGTAVRIMFRDTLPVR